MGTHGSESEYALKQDEDELDFIRLAEIGRRARLLMERDDISKDNATEKAKKWVASEIGQSQLSLPIEPVTKHVYKIYYRRVHDTRDSAYRLLLVVVKGILYDWPTTHKVLKEIICSRFDSQCDHVVVFHRTDEHDIDLPDIPTPESELNELARRRMIADLEKQIRALKNQ